MWEQVECGLGHDHLKDDFGTYIVLEFFDPIPELHQLLKFDTSWTAERWLRSLADQWYNLQVLRALVAKRDCPSGPVTTDEVVRRVARWIKQGDLRVARAPPKTWAHLLGTEHIAKTELKPETQAPAKAQLDFGLDLSMDGQDQILTPWCIPDYSELGKGTTKNQDYVKFQIKIEKNKVDNLEVEITAGKGSSKKSIFRKKLEEGLRAVGTHEWRWDGYSDAQILDTRVLKDPDLTLEFRAEQGGVTRTKTIQFHNKPAGQDWIDVVIDRNTKKVEVTLRVDIRDGGAHGVGELPPAEVWSQKSPNWSSIPATDSRRMAHARIRSFKDLEKLALSGLAAYWSRNATNKWSISTPEGPYTVDTKPISTVEKAMDDINVEYNTNAEWGRSSFPGSVRGFYSLIANIFVREHSIYNAGWIKYEYPTSKIWVYQNDTDEDDSFKETTAHEIGHEILSAYGGENYSYGHRGSSTVITQEKLSLTAGGVSYPAAGEIDLMKYYNGSPPVDLYARLVASEIDVKSLIWLARVEFHG